MINEPLTGLPLAGARAMRGAEGASPSGLGQAGLPAARTDNASLTQD